MFRQNFRGGNVNPVSRQIGQIAGDTSGDIHESGNTHTQSARDLARFACQFVDCLADSLKHLFGPCVRFGRNGTSEMNSTSFISQDAFN